MNNYDEWKLQPPELIEDDEYYINCELCNDVIAIDELNIMVPIINRHHTEIQVCKECFNLIPK